MMQSGGGMAYYTLVHPVQRDGIERVETGGGGITLSAGLLPGVPLSKLQRLAPLAQLDRAFDYGSKGWGFESLRAHRRN